ncbi:MAG: NUDIX hydrolase, partial [Candidatus Latescibacteria bacterium]|nr:NUDIX hydrolase [Candidatus Latescibacterota bacterium]
MQNPELRPWKTLSKKTILDHSKYLAVESHSIELPDGEIIQDWPLVIAPDAAVVLAITTDQKFLCFRQTKYAIQGTSLAPVGGL